MPSTGRRPLQIAGSGLGAPSSYTEFGPPDRITALAPRRSTSGGGGPGGSGAGDTRRARARRRPGVAVPPPGAPGNRRGNLAPETQARDEPLALARRLVTVRPIG